MLWHHRNLGKAFYENPATQYEAVDELRKALELNPESVRERINYGLALLQTGQEDKGIAELEKAQRQDSSIPHTWFCLGIAYKNQGRHADAIVQLQGMAERVPEEPITQYNLGVLHKLEGDRERAIEFFQQAADLAPDLAGPRFQLATTYRQLRRQEEAQREMAVFRELKQRQQAAGTTEDLEWSYYAELYDPIDPAAVRDVAVRAEPRFDRVELAQLPASQTRAGLHVIDLDGDGGSDLLAWGAHGMRLWRGGREAVPESGLCGAPDPECASVRAVAPGDIDNDGLVDLAVLTDEGPQLWRNQGGRFVAQSMSPSAKLPKRTFDLAIWLDYDHDYDVDLVLLGTTPALLRNAGLDADGRLQFDDKSADFPFVDERFAGGRATAAARFDLVADTQGMDLAIAFQDRPGVLLRDRLGGRYAIEPLPSVPAGTTELHAGDFDHDGWTDVLAARPEGAVLLRNQPGDTRSLGFTALPLDARAPLAAADVENRTLRELLSVAGVHRNRGEGRFAAARAADTQPAEGWPTSARHLVSADFDADGRVDVAALEADGTLSLLRNQTRGGGYLRVALRGVKNLQLAPGAEVEVRAGARYQKRLYDGVPLHFGLGPIEQAGPIEKGSEQVDAVRITWPNGLIQNEARQDANQGVLYEEAPRLSGSCPMVFTWDGEEYRFITDILGVAPLGAAAGDGEYFLADHDEYVQIPGDALAPIETPDGSRYEIRVTEELREVAYLDQLHLIAVDHPAKVDIFTNDKFVGPPFPEFRLYGVGERHYPVAARDHQGRDVLERLMAKDQRYPDDFDRDYAGVAELHHLELDFGDVPLASDGASVLVLAGWVDWADGSTFLGVSQHPERELIMPYLQMQDDSGAWQTVIGDLGIPAGKPKTIAVDLTGRWLSSSRKVRIVTNLCLYWDEIFLGSDPSAPPVQLTELQPEQAELRFRGFSKVIVHPERKQPERFVYAELRPLSMWNPTRGLYTRFGDVRPLLEEIDDRFVILGSGDELRLTFDADTLPTLPDGWTRDFLLFVDGWAKDGDANTGHSQTVEPLPYHAMPGYPYEAPAAYPDTPEHRLYREFYNTRPGLRFIRPLAGGVPGR